MQVGLQDGLSQIGPFRLPIKLLTKSPWALFPPVHGGSHTINVVDVVSQDYKAPQMYNNGTRKTEW